MSQHDAIRETIDRAKSELLDFHTCPSKATIAHFEALAAQALSTSPSPAELGFLLGWIQGCIYMRSNGEMSCDDINDRHPTEYLDLIFKGTPPEAVFVEAEINGESVRVGEWLGPDAMGFHTLRVSR